MVDWAIGEIVWILGRTRTGVLEDVGAEVKPLGEKVYSVPGLVGVDTEGENAVEHRLDVSFTLS